MIAVAVHGFANAFGLGVQKRIPVVQQLETHNFALDTARSFGFDVINEPKANWPRLSGEFAFGNPRCTAFSCLTGACKAETHGSFAKQTIDIVQLMQYSIGHFDVVAWESVQQAYTTGRPLLNRLVQEIVEPAGYRVCHILMSAHMVGNTQNRRRYFMVCYRKGLRFNLEVPPLAPHNLTVYDAIWNLRHRQTNEVKSFVYPWDADSYSRLAEPERHAVPSLPNGWGLSWLAQYDFNALHPIHKYKWRLRTSDTPFGLYAPYRLAWKCASPTLTSNASQFIHPDHDRTLTVREYATIMGWPRLPIGKHPAAQIAKGIVPDVGEWLAQNVVHCLNGHWGDDDWESEFTGKQFLGRNTHDALEKTYRLSKYIPTNIDNDRYPLECTESRFNVDPITGKVKRPWDDIAQ